MPKKVKQTDPVKMVEGVKLVAAIGHADLIKVMTIREKFVEQMPLIKVGGKKGEPRVDLHEHYAVVGITTQDYIVCQDIKGKLYKITLMVYVDYMLEDIPRASRDNEQWDAMQTRVKKTYSQIFLT